MNEEPMHIYYTRVEKNYKRLAGVLESAFNRAQKGKGRERHASGEAFHEQPICTEVKYFGIGCLLFQIRKKAQEVPRLAKEAAKKELYDIIVYAAAACIALEEKREKPKNL